jgi:hypothetical protein
LRVAFSGLFFNLLGLLRGKHLQHREQCSGLRREWQCLRDLPTRPAVQQRPVRVDLLQRTEPNRFLRHGTDLPRGRLLRQHEDLLGAVLRRLFDVRCRRVLSNGACLWQLLLRRKSGLPE